MSSHYTKAKFEEGARSKIVNHTFKRSMKLGVAFSIVWILSVVDCRAQGPWTLDINFNTASYHRFTGMVDNTQIDDPIFTKTYTIRSSTGYINGVLYGPEGGPTYINSSSSTSFNAISYAYGVIHFYGTLCANITYLCPGPAVRLNFSCTVSSGLSGYSWEITNDIQNTANYKFVTVYPGATTPNLTNANLTQMGLNTSGYLYARVRDLSVPGAVSPWASFKMYAPPATSFSVSGGGAYCLGPTGKAVFLSGSESSVNYQPKADGVNAGPVQAGTGSSLTWQNQTTPGTYTIMGTHAVTGCSQMVNGSVNIALVPLLPGATISTPIVASQNLSCATYTNQKIIGSGNCYGAEYGTGGDDIFYTFTIPYTSMLTASHCGTGFNTQLYVLSASSTVLANKAITAGSNCNEGNKISISLPAGTYYVVSKAASPSDQGALITNIDLSLAQDFYATPATATVGEDQPLTLTAPAGMTSIDKWSSSVNDVPPSSASSILLHPGANAVYQVKGIIGGCSVFASATVTVQADNGNYNYVKQTTLLVPAINSATNLDNLSVDQKNVTTTYIDGLGRVNQSVSWQASPGKKDVVQPVAYDDLQNRQSVKYLPYTSNGGSGKYKPSPLGASVSYDTQSPHFAFYNRAGDAIADDPKPYAKAVFEASPFNAVIKQGAVGAAWQPDAIQAVTDHTVKYDYGVNQRGEVLRFQYFSEMDEVSLAPYYYYEPGELVSVRTIDEQENEVIEYTDKAGKLVLRKVQSDTVNGMRKYASTYWVYNDQGDLVVVLSPELVKQLISSGTVNLH